VRILLEGGHRVRATVRSPSKGEHIAGLLGKRYPAKFEYVVVEDLEHEGAFDAAAHGVDGVLHTASPFHFDSEGRALDALINPAVNGTKNVLRSVLKADTVRRVVITSSFAAIGTAVTVHPTLPASSFTCRRSVEASSSNIHRGRLERVLTVRRKVLLPALTKYLIVHASLRKQSAEQGNQQGPMEAYRASKTLAERAAWEFVETHQPAWDLATINPPFVYGPLIQEVGK
jgi:nucleoside-diphosphate-sugar epimerase